MQPPTPGIPTPRSVPSYRLAPQASSSSTPSSGLLPPSRSPHPISAAATHHVVPSAGGGPLPSGNWPAPGVHLPSSGLHPSLSLGHSHSQQAQAALLRKHQQTLMQELAQHQLPHQQRVSISQQHLHQLQQQLHQQAAAAQHQHHQTVGMQQPTPIRSVPGGNIHIRSIAASPAPSDMPPAVTGSRPPYGLAAQQHHISLPFGQQSPAPPTRSLSASAASRLPVAVHGNSILSQQLYLQSQTPHPSNYTQSNVTSSVPPQPLMNPSKLSNIVMSSHLPSSATLLMQQQQQQQQQASALSLLRPPGQNTLNGRGNQHLMKTTSSSSPSTSLAAGLLNSVEDTADWTFLGASDGGHFGGPRRPSFKVHMDVLPSAPFLGEIGTETSQTSLLTPDRSDVNDIGPFSSKTAEDDPSRYSTYIECFLRGYVPLQDDAWDGMEEIKDEEKRSLPLEGLLKTLEAQCQVRMQAVWKEESWRRQDSGDMYDYSRAVDEQSREVWLRKYLSPDHLKDLVCLRMFGAEHFLAPPSCPVNVRRVCEATASSSIFSVLSAMQFRPFAPSVTFVKSDVFHTQGGSADHLIILLSRHFKDSQLTEELFPGKVLVEVKGRVNETMVDLMARRVSEFSAKLSPHVTMMKL